MTAMESWVRGLLPMVEGKCPPVTRINENGEWESCYPEPDPDYEDPEIRQEAGYSVEGKEEFYNYKTVCDSCGAEFIAYLDDELVRNYCPGCGKRLEVEPDDG